MENKFQNPNLVVKNGAFLLIRMLLVLFLGFFATRLTLQVLGDEKFGIYDVVGGIIAIFAIISIPIRDSLQRFFNVELANEVYDQDVVFSSSLQIVRYMVILITILYETIGLFLINYVIKYPTEETLTVNIVFQISVLTNILGFIALPYISLLFSRENMSIPAFCEIAGAFFKILMLYLIPFIKVDLLIPYACIFFLINSFLYLFYKIYCRRHYLECFSGVSGNKVLIKHMLGFSGWSFVESVAGIALTYVSNVFMNVFGGVLYNTAYGISRQLQNAVVSFSSNVLKAADPQISSSTATNNTHYRDQLVVTTAKISFIFTAFVFIIFYFDGELLLSLWLGRVPLYVTKFCKIMLLSIVFTSITLPFRTLIMASGHVRGYFMSYGLVSMLSMILMFSLLKLGLPVVCVMYLILACAVVMMILSIYFSHREASIDFGFVFKNLLLGFISVISSGITYYFVRRVSTSGLLGMFIALVISLLVLLPVGFYISFNSSEKNMVRKVTDKVADLFKLKIKKI